MRPLGRVVLNLPCMGGEKAPGSVPKEIRALYLLHLISSKSKVKWHRNCEEGTRAKGRLFCTSLQEKAMPRCLGKGRRGLGPGSALPRCSVGCPVLCLGLAGRSARISCVGEGSYCWFISNWLFSSPQTAPEVEEVKSSSTLLNVACAHVFIVWWLLHPQHSCLQIQQLSSFYGTCKSHSMVL